MSFLTRLVGRWRHSGARQFAWMRNQLEWQPGPQAPSRPQATDWYEVAMPAPFLGRSYYLQTVDVTAPAPLLVMLHGCRQTAPEFAHATNMNEATAAEGWFTLYPCQTNTANPRRCWNWFLPQQQEGPFGEAAFIAAAIDDALSAHPIDPARVYVAGLSAGGAETMVLSQLFPDKIAALGIHSGLAYGVAGNTIEALEAMRVGPVEVPPLRHFKPAIIIHGDQDATVHPRNALAVLEQLQAACPVVLTPAEETVPAGERRGYTRVVLSTGQGRPVLESWSIAGADHAWAGGTKDGSFTDPAAPSAVRAMVEFFKAQG